MDASVDDLVAFISSRNRGRIADPEQTSYLLQKATQDSYRLDKCLYEPLTVSIACSFNCISAFEKELKAINAAIQRAVLGLNPTEYQILTSVPNICWIVGIGDLENIHYSQCH